MPPPGETQSQHLPPGETERRDKRYKHKKEQPAVVADILLESDVAIGEHVCTDKKLWHKGKRYRSVVDGETYLKCDTCHRTGMPEEKK